MEGERNELRDGKKEGGMGGWTREEGGIEREWNGWKEKWREAEKFYFVHIKFMYFPCSRQKNRS